MVIHTECGTQKALRVGTYTVTVSVNSNLCLEQEVERLWLHT